MDSWVLAEDQALADMKSKSLIDAKGWAAKGRVLVDAVGWALVDIEG